MHFLVMSLSPLKVSETFSDDSKINEAERTPISFLSLWFMLCCYSGKNSPTWEMKKWILISSTGWTSTKIGFSIKKFDEINYIFLLLGNRVFRDFLPSSAWCTQKLLCAKLSFHNYFFVLLLIFKLKSLEIDENNGVVLFLCNYTIILLQKCQLFCVHKNVRKSVSFRIFIF